MDMKTDALVQTTISERFKECTVVTIAHRRETLAQSDQILLVGEEQVLSFNSLDEVPVSVVNDFF